MIEGISTRRVESTPAQDPTLGAASRQQQDKRGERALAGSGVAGFGGVLKEGSTSGAQVSSGDTLTLSAEAQDQVRKLQQRDREVRSHEQAHISAGGPHVTGGASYSYTRGPDGKQYAVGGSVSIDTSSIPGDPDATMEKARMVRSAALAPGAPSAQDQSVAASAASMEMQAQSEKRAEEAEGSAGAQGVTGGEGANAGGKKGQDSARGRSGISAVESQDSRQQDAATVGQGAAPGASTAASAASGSEGIEGARATTSAGEASASALSPAPSGSAGERRNTTVLLGAMEFQARNDRVAALYQAEQNKFAPVTALAPFGTGIGLQV